MASSCWLLLAAVASLCAANCETKADLARALVDFWSIAAKPGRLGRRRWPERTRGEQGFRLVHFWTKSDEMEFLWGGPLRE